MELALFLNAALSSVVAMVALGISVFMLKESRKRNRGSVLLGCLNKYLEIARLREDAIKEKSKPKARQFYREKFDLLWSEYRMWNSDLIPQHVMYVWANSLSENFEKGKIEFKTNNEETIRVSLAEVWDELSQENYFHPRDSFREFVRLIREKRVEEALALSGKELLDE